MADGGDCNSFWLEASTWRSCRETQQGNARGEHDHPSPLILQNLFEFD